MKLNLLSMIFTVLTISATQAIAYIGGVIAKENQFTSVLWIEYGCTGSLIAPSKILVAGHCVIDFKDNYKHFVGQQIKVYTKPKALSHSPITTTIRKVSVHPTWLNALNDADERQPSISFEKIIENTSIADIAIITVKENLTEISDLEPINLLDKNNYLFSKNTSFFVGGYGCESEGIPTRDPKYKYSNKKVVSHTDEYIFFNQIDSNKKTLSMGCEGDSGGPVFIKVRNGLYQVGLNSSVNGNELDGQLRVLKLENYLNWISKN